MVMETIDERKIKVVDKRIRDKGNRHAFVECAYSNCFILFYRVTIEWNVSDRQEYRGREDS